MVQVCASDNLGYGRGKTIRKECFEISSPVVGIRRYLRGTDVILKNENLLLRKMGMSWEASVTAKDFFVAVGTDMVSLSLLLLVLGFLLLLMVSRLLQLVVVIG